MNVQTLLFNKAILTTFEEADENNGDIFYPLKTQMQARAFVKAIQNHNIWTEQLCCETNQTIHDFSLWKSGQGLLWIGIRLMERVNNYIESVFQSVNEIDLLPGVSEKLTTAFDVEQNISKTKNSKLDGPTKWKTTTYSNHSKRGRKRKNELMKFEKDRKHRVASQSTLICEDQASSLHSIVTESSPRRTISMNQTPQRKDDEYSSTNAEKQPDPVPLSQENYIKTCALKLSPTISLGHNLGRNGISEDLERDAEGCCTKNNLESVENVINQSVEISNSDGSHTNHSTNVSTKTLEPNKTNTYLKKDTPEGDSEKSVKVSKIKDLISLFDKCNRDQDLSDMDFNRFTCGNVSMRSKRNDETSPTYSNFSRSASGSYSFREAQSSAAAKQTHNQTFINETPPVYLQNFLPIPLHHSSLNSFKTDTSQSQTVHNCLVKTDLRLCSEKTESIVDAPPIEIKTLEIENISKMLEVQNGKSDTMLGESNTKSIPITTSSSCQSNLSRTTFFRKPPTDESHLKESPITNFSPSQADIIRIKPLSNYSNSPQRNEFKSWNFFSQENNKDVVVEVVKKTKLEVIISKKDKENINTKDQKLPFVGVAKIIAHYNSLHAETPSKRSPRRNLSKNLSNHHENQFTFID